ncbi:MAG: CBS domain-containing protein [Nitrospiria bacterium]
MRVAEIMSRDLKWIQPTATVRKAVALMDQHRIGSVLVGGPNLPPAVMTETDVVRRVVAADRDPGAMRVDDAVSRPLITLDERQSIEEAGDLMAEHGVRHVGVTRRDELVGMVSVRDLLSKVTVLELPIERMMARSPIIVPFDESVRNAAALMTRDAVSAVLVAGPRGGARMAHARGFGRSDLAGLVTAADFVHRVVAKDRNPRATAVGEIMSALRETIDGRDPLRTAFAFMSDRHLRHAAVSIGDEIAGLLAIEDVFEPAWLHVAAPFPPRETPRTRSRRSPNT